jgi:hypothetical protein
MTDTERRALRRDALKAALARHKPCRPRGLLRLEADWFRGNPAVQVTICQESTKPTGFVLRHQGTGFRGALVNLLCRAICLLIATGRNPRP